MYVYGGCGYSGWMLVVVVFEIGCVEECAYAEGGASARKTASARVGVPMTVSLEFFVFAAHPDPPTHHSTPHHIAVTLATPPNTPRGHAQPA